MEAKFKRVVLDDEWMTVQEALGGGRSYRFESYALGWRLEPTPRELRLIEINKMFGRSALTIRQEEGGFNFAEVISPEFIPEVSQSPEHLLRIQALIQAAAAKWTIFFDSMDPTF